MKVPSTSEIAGLGGNTASTDTRATRRASTPSSSSSSSTSGGTSLTASDRLNQLESQFSQSDFNAQKVQDIQTAISQGRYTINSGAIADGLLGNASSMLGAA